MLDPDGQGNGGIHRHFGVPAAAQTSGMRPDRHVEKYDFKVSQGGFVSQPRPNRPPRSRGDGRTFGLGWNPAPVPPGKTGSDQQSSERRPIPKQPL